MSRIATASGTEPAAATTCLFSGCPWTGRGELARAASIGRRRECVSSMDDASRPLCRGRAHQPTCGNVDLRRARALRGAHVANYLHRRVPGVPTVLLDATSLDLLAGANVALAHDDHRQQHARHVD